MGWLWFLVPFGVGVMALREYRLAKTCFAISGLLLAGKIIMELQRSPGISIGWRVVITFITCGILGVSVLGSWLWADRKHVEESALAAPPKTSDQQITSLPLPASRKRLDSLLAAFKEPADVGIRLDMPPMEITINGQTTAVSVASEIDSRNQTYSVLFYIPNTPLTKELCIEFSNSMSEAYKYVKNFVTKSSSPMDDDTPLPESFMAIRNPKFSGNVIIYHEDKMTLSDKGTIDELFRKNGMGVTFRGWDYVIVQNASRGY